MECTLVVLAAGLGSRYGGVKQLAPVGPSGEALLDYAIGDGRAAGCTRTVVIVRSEINGAVAGHLNRTQPEGEVVLVNQDELGPLRSRPWGTTHAVLSAAKTFDGPFLVVNADDYYGPVSYDVAVKSLDASEPNHAVLVTFPLERTVPAEGPVTRGLCMVADRQLIAIVERTDIRRCADGEVHLGQDGPRLDPRLPVSMNMWGIKPEMIPMIERRFDEFLHRHGNSDRTECLLPHTIGGLVESGDLHVDIVHSDGHWTGLTNPGDLASVRSEIGARGALS